MMLRNPLPCGHYYKSAATGAILEMTEGEKLPQKRYFRQRAHCNPFSDHDLIYPKNPKDMNWKIYYPEIGDQRVEFADVGCGYGGLLVALSPLFPRVFMLGMEIRTKVTEYVKQRITALRHQNPGDFQNISVIRSNAMKHFVHFFEKEQLSKIFFLFPDPHFKKKKHKSRIISSQLLDEYAYLLKEGGRIYTITDVEELHEWMVKHLDSHPLFHRVDAKDLKCDIVMEAIIGKTEEGIKVDRKQGKKYPAVYEKRIIPI